MKNGANSLPPKSFGQKEIPGWIDVPQSRNRKEESTMIYKTIRIALMLVLATFAFCSASRAATCSNASLSGTYGFQHDGTDSTGAPATAAVSQITFDSTAGTFTVETTASHDGVIATETLTGTYTVASNCTGTGIPTGGAPFSIVVTSRGFLALHPFSEGFAVKQDSRPCTNARVEGSFGFETTGLFLAGAPATGWVSFIGELKLTVNASGEGVISGHVAGAAGSTTLAFAPVTGSYQVGADCSGTATITPKGQSALNFSFVVVDCGKEMLAVETDANTIVSGTLVRDDSGDRDLPPSASSMSQGRPANVNNTDSASDGKYSTVLKPAVQLPVDPS
jgi:hypothetical protein